MEGETKDVLDHLTLDQVSRITMTINNYGGNQSPQSRRILCEAFKDKGVEFVA
jgi:hypothetical protein